MRRHSLDEGEEGKRMRLREEDNGVEKMGIRGK